MQDVIVAIAIVFLVEGVLYTLFPEGMRNMMKAAIKMPESTLRYSGLVAAFLGFCVIYAVKH